MKKAISLIRMENIENKIKAFYAKTNFYSFDKIVSLGITEINNMQYIDAKIQVSRNGDKFIEKIFEPVTKFN